MIHLPIAAIVLIGLALFAGGYIVADSTYKPRCVVCQRPLPRICVNAECGQIRPLEPSRKTTSLEPSRKITNPAQWDRAFAKLLGARPEHEPARSEWDEAWELLQSAMSHQH